MPSTPRVTGSSSPSPARLDDAAKSWAEGFNFISPAAKRLAVARTKAPTSGPEALQRAFALHNTFNDRGDVKLLRASVNQQTVWAIHTQTEGDQGFLELFSDRGKLLATGTTQVGTNPSWDRELGAAREGIVPRTGAPSSVAAFFDSVDAAARAGTASGEKVAAGELREAAKALVGIDLTTSSLDREESAAMYRVLAAETPKLTAGARDFGSKLSALYLDRSPKKLRRLVERAASEVFGGESAFISASKIASAEVQGRKLGPKMASFIGLTGGAWAFSPTQVVPATRAEAIEVLKSAGASSSEARAIADHLAGEDAQLYTGRLLSRPDGRELPRSEGQAVFSASADGAKISAFFHPHVDVPPAEPREAIARLTGVDREPEILKTESVAGGQRFELQWRPFWGGLIQARVTVPNDPAIEPSVDRVSVPVTLQPGLLQALKADLDAFHGPTELLGWVGRDGNGPGFVIAHRPEGQVRPITVSTLRIGLDESGARVATVTPTTFTTADAGLAQELALWILRSEANKAVAAEPNDGLKLQVAMRTGWAQTGDLTRVRSNSPVGFNSRTELYQFEFPRAVGDAPMHVTYAKDGTLRIDGP